MHTRFLPDAPGYKKRVLHLLELELMMVVCHSAGAGNRMEASGEQVPLTVETSFHPPAHKLLTPRTETSRALVLNLPHTVTL